MAAESAAVLNVAPDHLDWHGTAEAYAAAKGRIYQNVQRACVYNVRTRGPSDWSARRTSSRAPAPSASPSAFPSRAWSGIVDGVLADRAFVDDRQSHAAELGSVDGPA